MQELKVIGIENGALIAASDDGDRYRVEIDAVMQTKIRQLQGQRAANTRVSPREIQAHIRAGMTREQAAAATGASVEDVERYELPVLAERDHVLSQALAAPVNIAGDDATSHTFGGVIRERLAALNARDERWACWKDEIQGWIVKVEFTAEEIDHDARWSFDLRGQALSPLNSEANTLSQHGEIRGGLIPKLRAVDTSAEPTDQSRFDSGAFVLADDALGIDTVSAPPEHSLPTATAAAMNREDEPAHNPNDTADLLEALRKRRGEREAMPEFDVFADDANATVVIERETLIVERETIETAIDTPVTDSLWGAAAKPGHEGEFAGEPAPVAGIEDAPKRRNGRTSLPSWDEIVFGSHGDEHEPA